jgi:predicted alpha/beta superfamily hydrolase
MFYLLTLALFFVGYLFIRAEFVSLTLMVEVPDYTPDRVYLIGNLASLGKWKRFQKKLEKVDERTYKTQLRVPRNQEINFKVSLGDWRSIQKNKRFGEVSNNTLLAEKSGIHHFTVENFGGFECESESHSRVGNFKVLRNFPSRYLGNHRNVLVYLPPSYAKEPERSFPVLYMHDGNNLFDRQTAFMGVEWEVDERAEELMKKNLMREIIIVGINNTAARMEEYTPIRSKQHGGGNGQDYLKFITRELAPTINRKFRTLKGPENTGIMGSSLGGLISLYAGFDFDDHFGLIGAISPSLWWADNYMEKEFMGKFREKKNLKIWMDMGTLEGVNSLGQSQAVSDTRRMQKLLLRMGYVQGEDLYYFEHRGATHDEASWAERIHLPLLYLFGNENSAAYLKLPWEAKNNKMPQSVIPKALAAAIVAQQSQVS